MIVRIGLRRVLLSACLSALLLTGCSPSLSPLYRDYEVPTDSTAYTAADLSRVKDALRDAGWIVRETEGSPVVKTEPKVVDNWILYKIEVTLETIPINDRYVRLYVHPRRQYITGGQTKLSFLKDRLREELIPPLNEAFSDHGFQVAGTPSPGNRPIGG